VSSGVRTESSAASRPLRGVVVGTVSDLARGQSGSQSVDCKCIKSASRHDVDEDEDDAICRENSFLWLVG